jgi:hypothetical protein
MFDMVRLAKDTIQDDLSQWIVPKAQLGRASESAGQNMAVPDPIAAENTWINTFYADWEYNSPKGWNSYHRLKRETWIQRDSEVIVSRSIDGVVLVDEEGNPLVVYDPMVSRNGRKESGFFGVINKVDIHRSWKVVNFSPRLKSEYIDAVPFSRTLEKSRSWDVLYMMIVDFSILNRTQIRLGLEGRQFYDLRNNESELRPGTITGDFRGSVLGLQLTTTRDYNGYSLTTQLGLRFDQRSLEVVENSTEKQTSGLVFLSVFAGL